jgi:hypothetical protein
LLFFLVFLLGRIRGSRGCWRRGGLFGGGGGGGRSFTPFLAAAAGLFGLGFAHLIELVIVTFGKYAAMLIQAMVSENTFFLAAAIFSALALSSSMVGGCGVH